MVLKAKTENNDGFERRTKNNDGSEHRTENVDGSERWNWKWWWLWTPKLRRGGGSERRNWEAMMALKAELKMLMALNAEAEKRWWI